MNVEKIDAIISDLTERLKAQRTKGQMWRGELSSSAISTSVAAFALYKIDAERYKERIDQAVEWLLSTMTEDGSWGDTPESPSNMTATLLSYTSLYAQGRAPEQTKR